MRSNRFWVGWGLLAFLIHLLAILPSLAPSIPGGHDSGELATDALVMGIPHPPGYPLYAMLGHLFSYLPVGEPIYRLNLFSAVCVSVAVGLLAVAFGRAATPIGGMTGALLFGFALSPWRMAVGAEVFGLHLCILSALVLAAILWMQAETEAGRRKAMLLGCAVFGLGAAHHHTIALAGLGLPLFFIVARGRGRQWGLTWWAPVVLVVLAFGPYLYLYVRARQGCPMNWGDPSTARNLLDHMLRKSYGSFALNPASGTVPRSDDAQVLAYLASVLRNQFPFPLALLGLGGLLVAFRRPGPLALYGWLFFIYGPGFALYSAQPPDEFFVDMVERFYSSSYVGIAGFVSLGVSWLEGQMAATRLSRLAWALPLISVMSYAMNYSACSQAGQYQADDHMEAILDYVPQGSFVFIDGDLPAGEYDYINGYLKRRPDVVGVFPGLLAADWYRRDFLPPGFDEEIARRSYGGKEHKEWLQSLAELCRERGIPTYATSEFHEAKEGQYLPEGLVFRFLTKAEKAPDKTERVETAKRVLKFLDGRPRRGDYRLDMRRQTFWTRYCISQWVRAYRNVAQDLFQKEPRLAEHALREAMAMEPNEPRDWVNLALLQMDRKDYAGADRSLDQALELEPEYPLALAAKVDLCNSQGKTRDAEEWMARLRERQRLGQ